MGHEKTSKSNAMTGARCKYIKYLVWKRIFKSHFHFHLVSIFM